MVADSNSNTVNSDSVGVLIDWFYSRFGLPKGSAAHEVWSHLLFGFSVTYQGEIYAAVPEMVLKHMAYGDNSLMSMPLGRRPTLEEVQENLVSFHDKLNSVFLEHRHDPWFFFRLFEDSNNAKSPVGIINDKIYDLYLDRYGEGTWSKWQLDNVKTCTYYEQSLISPKKRLPREIFEYAEKNFGSMPPRDEEAVNCPIVNPEDMKQQFPQYAAGMEYFCGIIEEYYGWEPFEDRYNRCVSQESRDFIAEVEPQITAVFEETERRVEGARSSATTLEPLSPERIEELYNLCVKVDEHIEKTIGKYPHQMTSNEIRELPMNFLREIREKFPWPHFDDNRPSSAGRADDPQLVFASRLLVAGASRA